MYNKKIIEKLSTEVEVMIKTHVNAKSSTFIFFIVRKFIEIEEFEINFLVAIFSSDYR